MTNDPASTGSPRAPLQQAITALAEGLKALSPSAQLDEQHYVGSPEENLVLGIKLSDFEQDLRGGDGNELGSSDERGPKPKFLAAHSSSALAVNTFARFKGCPELLSVGGLHGFKELKFERKFPTGLRGGRAPNLDVLVEGQDAILAIESKCTEYLRAHKPEFSPAYAEQIRDERRRSAWFEAMLDVEAGKAEYRWLDVVQLIKHAFGLARHGKITNSRVHLLYLFWEPQNATDFPIFHEHRNEAERLAQSVAGAFPEFRWTTYADLWNEWTQADEPDWLATHVEALRTRYEVAL